MNANLTIENRISKSKSLLERGRMILAKAAQPKLKFSSPEYREHEEVFYVIVLDQFDKEHEFTIGKKELVAFVADFYRSTMDTVSNGEHFQYEDTRSPLEYLSDNTDEVLIDYLNNRKS